MADDKDTIIDRIIDLLSDCLQKNLDEEAKFGNLVQVQELVIYNDLLDNFLDEIIGFESDRSPEVRKFGVGFIEAACIKDPDYFSQLLANLNYFLNETNSNVIKKAIQTATKLFKHFLVWLNKAKEEEQIVSAIGMWNQIKQQIIEMFDTTENAGIRTQCIKFMETLVILQTNKDKWTVQENEFDLSEIKKTNLIDLKSLEDEAKQVLDSLVIFHNSPHISSVNLMATMQSLVLICRNRSSYFMAKVIQSLETLHANLPPTLAKSQVSSVRKQLKLQLQILLKHPAAALNPAYQLQVTQLLNDLGATQSDVHKCLQEVRKRGLKIEQVFSEPKRIKLESDSQAKNEATDSTSQSIVKPSVSQVVPAEIKPIDCNLLKVTKADACTAVDITAESLIPKLSDIENACDLVLVSLLSMPEQMPAHFQASYTPLDSTGTQAQIIHLSRLLATRFTGAGIGRGVQEVISKIESSLGGQESIEDKQHHKISSLIRRGIAQEIKKQEIIKNKSLNKAVLGNKPVTKTVSVTKEMKQLNFAKITKTPTNEFRVQMVFKSVQRILDEEDKLQFSASQQESRIKILSQLAVKYFRKNADVFNLIKDYAFEDLRSKMVILTSTVNDQHELFKSDPDAAKSNFNDCLVSIVTDFIYKTDSKDRDHFLPKFYAELPDLTDDAIGLLKDYILLNEASTIENGFNIAKVLIENIGGYRFKVLNLILQFCLDANAEVRNLSTKIMKQLHAESDEKFREEIEKISFQMLQDLLDKQQQQPPPTSMDEESIKLSLLPYLNLLPSNHKLIHSLATIYVSMNANIKRVILRSLEASIKGMGMNSPEFLLLVENCPKGAETLVTRIHVLTDKQPPSAELVSRVRDLYHKRVPDVRFLIPVLSMSCVQSSQTKKSSLFRLDCSSRLISQNSYLSERKSTQTSKKAAAAMQKGNSFDSDERNVISIYDDQQIKNQDNILRPPICENILVLFLLLMKFVNQIDEKLSQDTNTHCVLYGQLKSFINSFIKIQLNSYLDRVLNYFTKCLGNFTVLSDGLQLAKLNQDRPLLLSTEIIVQTINDMRQLMHKLTLNCEELLLMINKLAGHKDYCTIYKMIAEKEKTIISANSAKDEDISRCLKSLPSWVNLSKYYYNNTNGQLYLNQSNRSRMSNLSFGKQDESPDDVHLRNKRETELLISNITQESLIPANDVANNRKSSITSSRQNSVISLVRLALVIVMLIGCWPGCQASKHGSIERYLEFTDQMPDLPDELKEDQATSSTSVKFIRRPYFEINYYDAPETFEQHWAKDMHTSVRHDMKNRQVSVQLPFEYPFYGSGRPKVIVSVNGFLFVGNFFPLWQDTTRYIAPLMCNFSIRQDSSVYYRQNQTAFVVQWDNVYLQERKVNSTAVDAKQMRSANGFSFQAILKKSGELFFLYKQIPFDINGGELAFKVGVSDAYLIRKESAYLRRSLITSYPITNQTVIWWKPLLTCKKLPNEIACLNNSCSWCAATNVRDGVCSDEYDRLYAPSVYDCLRPENEAPPKPVSRWLTWGLPIVAVIVCAVFVWIRFWLQRSEPVENLQRVGELEQELVLNDLAAPAQR